MTPLHLRWVHMVHALRQFFGGFFKPAPGGCAGDPAAVEFDIRQRRDS